MVVGVRKNNVVAAESESFFMVNTATENRFKTVLITFVQQAVYKLD